MNLPDKYSELEQKFDLLADEPLKNYTSFRVGGPADLLGLPKNREEFEEMVRYAHSLKIPLSIFGGGTNLLVSDRGIRGLVLITKFIETDIETVKSDRDESIIKADAGKNLSRLYRYSVNHSLSGLEFTAGIPGTLGGAIMMNAGAWSGEMSCIVESVEILSGERPEIRIIGKKDIKFSYRETGQDGVILAATLKLKKADREKIRKTFKENLQRKKSTQPLLQASAGCFFKNPGRSISAGELIEKSGLKGVKIKDAMVSEKHAGFIVNTGRASCKDILALKELVQRKVFEKYNIRLETEVRVEGE